MKEQRNEAGAAAHAGGELLSSAVVVVEAVAVEVVAAEVVAEAVMADAVATDAMADPVATEAARVLAEVAFAAASACATPVRRCCWCGNELSGGVRKGHRMHPGMWPADQECQRRKRENQERGPPRRR